MVQPGRLTCLPRSRVAGHKMTAQSDPLKWSVHVVSYRAYLWKCHAGAGPAKFTRLGLGDLSKIAGGFPSLMIVFSRSRVQWPAVGSFTTYVGLAP